MVRQHVSKFDHRARLRAVSLEPELVQNVHDAVRMKKQTPSSAARKKIRNLCAAQLASSSHATAEWPEERTWLMQQADHRPGELVFTPAVAAATAPSHVEEARLDGINIRR